MHTLPKLDRLAMQINAYTGGFVTRSQVEQVLDFNILLEPADQADPDAEAMYAARTAKWQATIEKGNAIVRQYGTQMSSRADMQDRFYSFTNSPKYRKTLTSISVARTVLNSCWDGIHGWKE